MKITFSVPFYFIVIEEWNYHDDNPKAKRRLKKIVKAIPFPIVKRKKKRKGTNVQRRIIFKVNEPRHVAMKKVIKAIDKYTPQTKWVLGEDNGSLMQVSGWNAQVSQFLSSSYFVDIIDRNNYYQISLIGQDGYLQQEWARGGILRRIRSKSLGIRRLKPFGEGFRIVRSER